MLFDQVDGCGDGGASFDWYDDVAGGGANLGLYNS